MHKNGFGIKYPTMVDMPLNKHKTNPVLLFVFTLLNEVKSKYF